MRNGNIACSSRGRVRRRLAAGVTLAGAVLASSACGAFPDLGDVPGLGSVPGLGEQQQTEEAEPTQVRFPPVENPRDVRAVADRPCDLLREEQAAEFAIDVAPRELPGVLGGVDCEWRSSTAHVWVYISTSTDGLSLEEVYRSRDTLPYFEVTEIEGYPAVVSRTVADLPVCDIDIKLAARQSVTVSYDSTAFNDQPEQGCVVGKRVAEAVLDNVPPAG